MIVEGLRFGHSDRDVPSAGPRACRETMNARAQTRPRPSCRGARRRDTEEYGAASPAPFDGFNDSGFGIPTTRDVLEAPDAGGRAAGRGVLGALARTLTSGPVVKSAGCCRPALGRRGGNGTTRETAGRSGSTRWTSIRLGTRASLSRSSPGHHSSLGLRLAPPRASPLGSPPDARRDLDLRWRFTVATPRASSRKRRFSRHVERSRRVLARL